MLTKQEQSSRSSKQLVKLSTLKGKCIECQNVLTLEELNVHLDLLIEPLNEDT